MENISNNQTALNFVQTYRKNRMNYVHLLCTILKVNIEVAERIVNRFRPFELNRIDRYDLMKVEGVTDEIADTFFACFELVRMVKHEEIRRQKMEVSRDVFQLMCPIIGHLNYEEFYIILLNQANKIIKVQRISQGGISGTVIDVRIIYKHAINLNACSVIMAHNHPSGNIKPSDADIQITKKCREAGKTLDVPVMDHLIVTEKEYYSFADEGII